MKDESDNLVLSFLIYLKPVVRIWNKINMMKFRRFDESTSSTFEKKLRTILIRVAGKISRRELQ